MNVAFLTFLCIKNAHVAFGVLFSGGGPSSEVWPKVCDIPEPENGRPPITARCSDHKWTSHNQYFATKNTVGPDPDVSSVFSSQFHHKSLNGRPNGLQGIFCQKLISTWFGVSSMFQFFPIKWIRLFNGAELHVTDLFACLGILAINEVITGPTN